MIVDDIDALRSNVTPPDEVVLRLPDSIRPHERACALRLASEFGHAQALQRMLAAQWGASLSAAGVAAASSGHLDCLELLRQHGFQVDCQGGEALFSASARGHGGCLEYLLKAYSWEDDALLEALLSALANHHSRERDILLSHAESLAVDLVTGNEADIVGACMNNSGENALDVMGPFLQRPGFLPALEGIALPKAVAFFNRTAVQALLDVGCNPCANNMQALLTGLQINAPDALIRLLMDKAIASGGLTQQHVSLIDAAGFTFEAHYLSYNNQ